MISIVILTKNEEQDLPGCLASVGFSDDIHVFDSFSTDRTVAIAEEAGAIVTQRVFEGYAKQRNAALALPFKNEWLFILDADERIPEALIAEINITLKTVASDVNGFRIKRRDFLNDTWLKHAQISPYYIRLVRSGKANYHREINEVIEVQGNLGELKSYFDHYPFSKGYRHWLDKHNVYSTMEAQRWIDEHNLALKFSVKIALFGNDFSEKRYHQKGLFYKIPARYILKWFYMVVWRRAFLDGKAGFTYATLQSIYEYFIILKTKEILHKNNLIK